MWCSSLFNIAATQWFDASSDLKVFSFHSQISPQVRHQHPIHTILPVLNPFSFESTTQKFPNIQGSISKQSCHVVQGLNDTLGIIFVKVSSPCLAQKCVEQMLYLSQIFLQKELCDLSVCHELFKSVT